MSERITPARRDEWSPDMAEFFAAFRSNVRDGKPDNGRPSGGNLLGTLIRHPELAKAFLHFNGHLLYGTSLTKRQRETVILRVARRKKSDYEYAQHMLLARDAGMTDEEIARASDGADAPGWTDPVEQALVRAVDDLLDEGMVADDTWAVLSGAFDTQQLMDVVFTVGTYAMVAMALRSFGVQPEPELVPHLPARQ